jgi:hypothetical protein
MDAIAPKKTRNSRWDRKPVVDGGAKPAIAYLTERDIEIFKCLARYQYLPSDYIHAFVRGNYKSLIHRLNLLSRKPNLYINRPHQQREHAEANYRKLVYELDNRGAQVLRDRDFGVPKKKYHRNFAHELMICQIAASIELGTIANANIKLIRWSAILASDKLPDETRRLSNPLSIPIGDHCKISDGEPFVIVRQFETTTFIFLVQEADCGTEPIDATDNDRSSIRRMFEDYLTIIEQRIYQKHFGANTFMVAIVTTNETRMNSMMALLERMNTGQAAMRFLFKHIPVFTSYEQSAPATGHMLTEPWKRAGYPDFYLDKA